MPTRTVPILTTCVCGQNVDWHMAQGYRKARVVVGEHDGTHCTGCNGAGRAQGHQPGTIEHPNTKGSGK